jgi:ribosomal protein S8
MPEGPAATITLPANPIHKMDDQPQAQQIPEKREWKPEPGRSFLDLSFKGRVQAQTGGANNFYTKTLTLCAMQQGLPCTVTELYGVVSKYLGREPPFGFSIPFSYCKKSMHNIGLVVRGTVRIGRRTPSAFAKTQDADTYALPIAAKLLTFCAKHSHLSMTDVMGETHTTGAFRRGYANTMALSVLHDGEVHTQKEITANFSSVSNASILQSLKQMGFIKYKTVKKDPYDGSEKDYSNAKLKSKEKAERLALEIESGNMEKLKRTQLYEKSSGKLSRSRTLLPLLRNPPQTINSRTIAKIFVIQDIWHQSQTLSALCDLGIYERTGFTYRAQSEAEITDLGREAYDQVFRHVIEVSKNPGYAQTSEFRKEYQLLDKAGWLALLRVEEPKYILHKVDPGHSIAIQALQLLRLIEEKFGCTLPFRAKDIRQICPDRNKKSISDLLYHLNERGYIITTKVDKQNAKGITTQKNYYTLNKEKVHA